MPSAKTPPLSAEARAVLSTYGVASRLEDSTRKQLWDQVAREIRRRQARDELVTSPAERDRGRKRKGPSRFMAYFAAGAVAAAVLLASARMFLSLSSGEQQAGLAAQAARYDRDGAETLRASWGVSSRQPTAKAHEVKHPTVEAIANETGDIALDELPTPVATSLESSRDHLLPPTVAGTSHTAAGTEVKRSSWARRNDSSATTPGASKVSPTPPREVENEDSLMQRARVAVRDGRPARALQLLGRHHRLFPHGLLAEERDVLRVIAACRAGHRQASHRFAARFLAQHPHSIHRTTVQSTCVDPE